MTQERIMRRLRSANPAPEPAQPSDADELFARLVAAPGDPRLAAEHDRPPAHTDRLQAGRRRFLRRPRMLAGGTLGLAGVGVALVIALGAAGSSPAPAFAVTTSADGSVLVKLTGIEAVPGAERQLAAMGINEWFDPAIAGGASDVGPVSCTPAPGASGPPVKVLLGSDGSASIPVGQAGAGSWHLVGCALHTGTYPGAGNTGSNTGSTGS